MESRLWRIYLTLLELILNKVLALTFVFFLLGCQVNILENETSISEDAASYEAKIIRDIWGVPHIFGKTDADVAFGLAFAHAEDDIKNIAENMFLYRAEMGLKEGQSGAVIDYLIKALKIRENIDAKNQADSMIHSAEKNLTEFGEKVSDQEKNAIENDIKNLKDAIASDDSEKIKSGLEALTQSSMKLGEAMYKSQQQDASQPSDQEQATGDKASEKNEKVVDAEFEEVKEDNKQS